MSNLNGRIIVPWLAFEGLTEETFMSNVTELRLTFVYLSMPTAM